MQAAIDAAKRAFEIDIPSEIKRIRKEIDVDNIGFPEFWLDIREGFKRERINHDIVCPMNELHKMEVPSYKPETSTIPTIEFINNYEQNGFHTHRISRKIASLITKYSIELYNFRVKPEEYDVDDECLLLRSDFDELVEEVRRAGLTKKYLPLMSWLINRGFRNAENTYNLQKNRSILLSILYQANPQCLLKLFDKKRKIRI